MNSTQAETLANAAATVASVATSNPEILVVTQAVEEVVNAIIELEQAKSTGTVSESSWKVLTESLRQSVSAWNKAQ